MKQCDALIIGGSAGSLDVLFQVLPFIKSDIAFAIIIVLHRKAGNDSILPGLLNFKTKLQVREVEEKEKILAATIYIAPSDYHLLIENDHTFSLDRSEKVNYSRPSIDVTFQSAAEVYKDHLVCLLLSGSNIDGIEGLKRVKYFGGKVIIQNPESAAMPYMPAQAELNVDVDKILPINEMADYINALSQF
ncbi:MAG: chemotaxis protein CheB [Ginsengibacter sp.]